ncbi:MAG TPA: hypothetical protein GXX36_09710 [Clostridiaceae bacterium]|nr:hypothetical protein [Clostridiaceae bacterium]
MTPPSDEALRFDIEMTKSFGFLLVWGEMLSPYDFNVEQTQNVVSEFIGFINRDYNHPSIMACVPLNESWGVGNIVSDKMQQNFGMSLYHIAKAMDQTREVIRK